jgi:hypothetical protein
MRLSEDRAALGISGLNQREKEREREREREREIAVCFFNLV